MGASSRDFWRNLRDASGRNPSGRSNLGMLVDPLGLFSRSSMFVMDDDDARALEVCSFMFVRSL